MYEEKVEKNLPIRALCYINIATFMYNCIHKKILTNFDFAAVNPGSSRRDEYFKPDISKTSIGARKIETFGPKIFNSVPNGIKKMSNQHSFKASLVMHIKNPQFLKSCFNNDFLKKYT